MARHRQIELSPWQVCHLDRWRAEAFRRVYRLAERCLSARASADTLEALVSGCSRLFAFLRLPQWSALGIPASARHLTAPGFTE